MRRGNINNKREMLDEKIEQKNEIANEDVIVNDEPVESDAPVQTVEKNAQNKDKVKIIVLIVGIVLAVLITAALLIYKYVKTNNKVDNNNVNKNDNIENIIQNKNEDSKYLVSFKDMYEPNPLIITKKLEEKEATAKEGRIYIEYVQIAGLQDKQLQENINKQIKNNAYYYKDKLKAKQEYISYTRVQGNFSNILSIVTDVSIYEKDDIVFKQTFYLNYNLATGEQIKFLDLFASNTPMNSIIYDIEYKRLAWDTEFNLDMSYEELDKATNMDKRDTSEYEDLILKVINKYKKLDKDKITFSVSPKAIYVNLAVGDGGEEVTYTIELYKYIDYVTMYKKFLTDKVIYEDKATYKLLVFNDMMEYKPLYYKFELDNLFISIFSYMDDEYSKEERQALIEEYSAEAVNKTDEIMQKHIDKAISDVKTIAKTNKNKGYMARFIPYCNIEEHKNEYGKEALIYVTLDGAFEEMNIDYYNENALKLLAKQNIAPKVSIDSFFAGNIGDNNKNVKSLLYNEGIENPIELIGYYTLDGVKVATEHEDVEKYINGKYVKPEEEKTEVNIYGEE